MSEAREAARRKAEAGLPTEFIEGGVRVAIDVTPIGYGSKVTINDVEIPALKRVSVFVDAGERTMVVMETEPGELTRIRGLVSPLGIVIGADLVGAIAQVERALTPDDLVVIETPECLNDEQHARIMDDVHRLLPGKSVLVLEGGMKLHVERGAAAARLKSMQATAPTANAVDELEGAAAADGVAVPGDTTPVNTDDIPY